MVKDLPQKWLSKPSKLNPAAGANRFRGKAPHKPLLLLCILDMAEKGELRGRTLTRTPGLVARFKEYVQLFDLSNRFRACFTALAQLAKPLRNSYRERTGLC